MTTPTTRVLMLLENDGYPSDTRVVNEATELVRAGREVCVICPATKGQLRSESVDGVRVYRYPSPSAADGFAGHIIEYAWAMVAIWLLTLFVGLRNGFDVLHLHNPPDTLFLIALMYKPFGKKVVYDHHDIVPELCEVRFGAGPLVWLTKVLEGWSCRVADIVLTVNDSSCGLLRTRHGLSPERLFIVRNGPDLARLETLNLNGAWNAHSDDKTLIGYIGYIDEQDEVHRLLYVLHRLVFEMNRRDLHCVVIGDGAALPSVKAEARRMKLDGFVTFKGRLPWEDAMACLADTDICVDPASYNCYYDKVTAVKLIEYMALGKPIVAFSLTEHHYSAHGAALFAASSDEEAFAANIARLIDEPSLRSDLCAEGRKRVEDLSWNRAAEQLIEAYRALDAA